jgi:hypothetical protein
VGAFKSPKRVPHPLVASTVLGTEVLEKFRRTKKYAGSEVYTSRKLPTGGYEPITVPADIPVYISTELLPSQVDAILDALENQGYTAGSFTYEYYRGHGSTEKIIVW